MLLRIREALKSKPRLKKAVAGLLIFLICFTIVGALIMPPVVKSVLASKLSEKLHRDVSVQSVRINPFSLSITLRDFLIKERNAGQSFISFEELNVNIQSISLFKKGVIIAELKLRNPFVSLVRNEDGTYNFSDLLSDNDADKTETKSPFLFSLNNVQISDLSMDFSDRLKKREHTLRNGNVTIPFLSNRPAHVQTFVNPFFAANINGQEVLFSGSTKPFANSMETNIDVEIKDVDIPHYLGYSPFKMNFKLLSGLFSTRTSVSYIQYKDRAPALSVNGQTELRNVKIVDNMDNSILSLSGLNAEIASSDLIARQIFFSIIGIESPELNLLRNANGDLNILSLISEKAEKKSDRQNKGSKKPLIEAESIVLNKGKVFFTDKIKGNFRTDLEDLSIKISGFSTQENKKTRAETSFKSESGEHFRLTSLFSIVPFEASGAVELSDVVIKKYAPYFQDNILFGVRSGGVDLNADYLYVNSNTSPLIKVTGLRAKLKSLRLGKKGESEDFLSLPSLVIDNSSIDWQKREVVIGHLTTENGKIAVRRYHNGKWNLATLTSDAGDNKAKTEKRISGHADKKWAVTVKSCYFNRYAFRLDDMAPDQAVKLEADRVAIRAENISTIRNRRGNVDLSLVLNGRGKISAKGSLGIEPTLSNMRVALKNIPIVPFQPYLTDRINIYITDGSLFSEGLMSLKYDTQKGVNITYQGEASLNRFASADKIKADDFLKWETLHLDKMDIGYKPLSVKIGEVALSDFYSRIIINSDGTMNVQNIIKKEDKPEELDEPAQPAGPAKEPIEKRMDIDKVTVQGGTINFSDYYIKPNYSANFYEIGGRISGLSSEENRFADVNLRGKLNNYAPLEITGKINPLRDDLFVDLSVSFKDMDLSPVTPYSGKYLGYTVEKGKLSLNLEYLIVNRKLDSENKIFIDQLTLGDKVSSHEATKLPVKLAIALLKNSRGEISLDMPVSGSLDDPEFSTGRVIIKMLVNLLVKAATSPFALLGAIFGGGEEMSYVEFDFGSSRLNEQSINKLEKLGKALNERPSLRVDMVGHVDIDKDREGLRKYIFDRKIKAQKFKELAKKGSAPQSVDDVIMEEGDYAKYLKMAYKHEDFPKPKTFFGFLKDIPNAEMEKLMFTHIIVSDDELRNLSSQRAQKVKDYILKTGHVEPERIFLIEPKTLEPEKKEDVKNSRVDFKLH